MVWPFSTLDAVALGVFLAAWLFYGFAVERGTSSARSLNMRMNVYRREWMLRTFEREQRIVDASIMATLQNGASFFASTMLLAMGGSLALLRSPDEALRVLADLPFAQISSRVVWEYKIIGLVVIFAYAFFKFAWSYRLFNYAAIMIGAMPPRGEVEQGLRHVYRAAGLQVAAGAQFNRGQRALFFALAYLGWMIGPVVLLMTTALVLGTMWFRQFHSGALHAVLLDETPGAEQVARPSPAGPDPAGDADTLDGRAG